MPAERLREFATNTVREIKNVSPKTVPLVVHTGELKLTPYFVDIEGLDIIGINVYGTRDIEKVEQAIIYIKKHGKKPWIFETWLLTQKRGREHYIWFRDCC